MKQHKRVCELSVSPYHTISCPPTLTARATNSRVFPKCPQYTLYFFPIIKFQRLEVLHFSSWHLSLPFFLTFLLSDLSNLSSVFFPVFLTSRIHLAYRRTWNLLDEWRNDSYPRCIYSVACALTAAYILLSGHTITEFSYLLLIGLEGCFSQTAFQEGGYPKGLV